MSKRLGIILQHWTVTSLRFNLEKDDTPFHVVNMITADDLAEQGARASTAMFLTWILQNTLALASRKVWKIPMVTIYIVLF